LRFALNSISVLYGTQQMISRLEFKQVTEKSLVAPDLTNWI